MVESEPQFEIAANARRSVAGSDAVRLVSKKAVPTCASSCDRPQAQVRINYSRDLRASRPHSEFVFNGMRQAMGGTDDSRETWHLGYQYDVITVTGVSGIVLGKGHRNPGDSAGRCARTEFARAAPLPHRWIFGLRRYRTYVTASSIYSRFLRDRRALTRPPYFDFDSRTVNFNNYVGARSASAVSSSGTCSRMIMEI